MKIFICTPCYSGNVNGQFAISLISTIRAVHQSEITFLANFGNSLIHMARNQLVAQAMAGGADKIVFIDDDVSWKIPDFEKLMFAPASICAGVYQKKTGRVTDKADMAVSLLPEGMPIGRNGLVEVDAAATGFLRIDRQVFEAMKPGVQKIHDDTMPKEIVDELFEYFSFGKLIKDGKTYVHGEDYSFCHKAREAGHKIYIDPNLHLGHHAGGFKWDAHLKTVELL